MKLVELHSDAMPMAYELYKLGADRALETVQLTNLDDACATAFVAPRSIWRLGYEKRLNGESVLVGLCALENIRPFDRVCEIYFAIHPPARRQGRGLQLMTALRDFAFDTMNMRRIQTTMLFDSPARTLLEKLDFKLEGTHRAVRFRNGKYVDAVTYALIKE